jgi:hypothetical protein
MEPLDILCTLMDANGTSYDCQLIGLDATGVQSIQSTFRGPSNYPSVTANPQATDPKNVPRRQAPFPS